jgi:hypothetical protein
MEAFTKDQERRVEEIVTHYYGSKADGAIAARLDKFERWGKIAGLTSIVTTFSLLVGLFFALPGMAANKVRNDVETLSKNTGAILTRVGEATTKAEEAQKATEAATAAANAASVEAARAKEAAAQLESVDVTKLATDVRTISSLVSTPGVEATLKAIPTLHVGSFENYPTVDPATKFIVQPTPIRLKYTDRTRMVFMSMSGVVRTASGVGAPEINFADEQQRQVAAPLEWCDPTDNPTSGWRPITLAGFANVPEGTSTIRIRVEVPKDASAVTFHNMSLTVVEYPFAASVP